MAENNLVRLLEHNNWANLRILEACESLSDEQLDFKPESAVHGTIRDTLRHLVTSQEDYMWMLTKFDHPPERDTEPTLSDLRVIAVQSGSELVSLIQGNAEGVLRSRIALKDGYSVDLG